MNGSDPSQEMMRDNVQPDLIKLAEKALRKKFGGELTPNGEERTTNRFRDIGQLRYLFRSIMKNGGSWARRIFLVTNNQVPE